MPRSASLIWLDPGETTGFIALTCKPGWLAGEGTGTWDTLGRVVRAQITEYCEGDEDEQIARLVDAITCWSNAAYGMEDFVIRTYNTSRAFLSPVRIISGVRACVRMADGRLPFMQQPSMAKSVATDERLKMAGLYAPGLPHGTDAARHAAVFLRRARSEERLRRQAWPEIFD